MEIIALLSNRGEVITGVTNCLGKYIVCTAQSRDGLDELLLSLPVGLIILDGASVNTGGVAEIMSAARQPVVLVKGEAFQLRRLAVEPEIVDERELPKILPSVVSRLFEKTRLEARVDFLSRQGLNGPAPDISAAPLVVDGPARRFMQEQMLLNFAKTLTVHFDLQKLLDHFMDSVVEITRVNKMSIMLREDNTFRIKAQVGINPHLAENIKFTNDSPLIRWLAANGRILGRSLNIRPELYPDILKEMDLLQCVFSFPMLSKGKLIGVFNIDSKVAGDPFYREELEVIYVLCKYLTAAVRDIDSYHSIQYQKEFTRNILANMQSGVITINADERISVFNQRAAEILGMNSADVLGSDLRQLPSPLGDILFETMNQGNSYRRHEITIRPAGIPLGITSSRLLDEERRPVGAVIVFTDLSDCRKLEEERRKAEKLAVIHDLIGRIAHSVKTPLTSIQTFTQLLDEKFADKEFREFFSHTVMQSVQQLNGLIDRLVLFSGPLDLRLEKCDLDELVEKAEKQALHDLPPDTRMIRKDLGKKVFVTADRSLLPKAIYYLIVIAANRCPKGEYLLLRVTEPAGEDPSLEISITFPGPQLTDEERDSILKPLLDTDSFVVNINVPISQKIIEEHSGRLTLIQGEEGNSFVVSLPAVEKPYQSMSEDVHGKQRQDSHY